MHEFDSELEKKARSDGWTRAELYVMKTLERMETNQIAMRNEMTELNTSIVRMKTEARVRSSIFGAISAVASTFIIGLLKKFGIGD